MGVASVKPSEVARDFFGGAAPLAGVGGAKTRRAGGLARAWGKALATGRVCGVMMRVRDRHRMVATHGGAGRSARRA